MTNQFMDTNKELKSLRHLREISLATRELDEQFARVRKRYNRGINILRKHAESVDRAIDEDELPLDWPDPIDAAHPDVVKLLADPKLSSIPDDVEP